MTDLPFDFSSTLDAFECPESIKVYEKTGSYVNGRWVETKSEERSLNCILLNVDEFKQEVIASGRYLEAAYCVMFPEGVDTLYVGYQQNNTIQGKQSYIVVDGLEYIVKNNPETVKNAGFLSYYALRYKEQENVSDNN